MLVSPAFAQVAGQTGGIAGGIEAFLPLVLIFVVFYFLMIRPQQKKAKAHRELLGQLRRGDRVVTSGGILGTVNKVVDEKEVVVEIAEGVRVRVLRSTILDIISKTEPVAAAKADAEVDKPADK